MKKNVTHTFIFFVIATVLGLFAGCDIDDDETNTTYDLRIEKADTVVATYMYSGTEIMNGTVVPFTDALIFYRGGTFKEDIALTTNSGGTSTTMLYTEKEGTYSGNATTNGNLSFTVTKAYEISSELKLRETNRFSTLTATGVILGNTMTLTLGSSTRTYIKK